MWVPKFAHRSQISEPLSRRLLETFGSGFFESEMQNFLVHGHASSLEVQLESGFISMIAMKWQRQTTGECHGKSRISRVVPWDSHHFGTAPHNLFGPRCAPTILPLPLKWRSSKLCHRWTTAPTLGRNRYSQQFKSPVRL